MTKRDVSRRDFLAKVTGGVGSSLVLWHPAGRAAASTLANETRLSRTVGPMQVASVATGELTLVRAADQLHLTFGFIDLEVQGDQLVPLGPNAGLRATIGSQHSAEEYIVSEAGGLPPTATEAMDRRGAASSRLVVAVTQAVPFTVAGLLGLLGNAPRLDGRATGTNSASVPTDTVTALEVPADVVLSPASDGRFVAETAPIEANGVTELWRLRLGSLDGDEVRLADANHPVDLRAIYGGNHPDAFPRPLDQQLREALVDATTNWSSPRYPDNEPLRARGLSLSMHGASADLAGTWVGTGSLAGYAELINSGATLASTVTERGYLAPFGMPASVVTVTERRFSVAGDGSTVAVLDTHERLVIDDSRIDYPRPFMPHDGRGWPFTSVQIVGQPVPLGRGEISWTNPTLGLRSIDPERIFMLIDATTDATIQWDHVAVDRAGHEIGFQTPAYFVTADAAFATGFLSPQVPALADLGDFFTEGSLPDVLRRFVDMDDQAIAFADEADPGSGSTAKTVNQLILRIDRPTDRSQAEMLDAGQPAFYPAMDYATVKDEALNDLSGDGSLQNLAVALDPAWLSDGLGDDNVGNAFLRLTNPAVVDFSSSEGGGLVAPVLDFDTFTQDIGVASSGVLAAGEWDPAAALGDARLLGLIPLDLILGAIPLPGPDLGGLPGLPSFESISLPDEICQVFSWEPELRTWELAGTDVFVVTDDLGGALDNPFSGPTKALVELKSCIGLESVAPPSTTIDVSITNVVVQLPPGAPALAIQLGEVRWSGSDDSAGNLDLDVTGYQFVGILEILEPLRDFLSAGSVGADIDIDPAVGVDVELRASPPNFSLGVIAVSNVWVSLGLFVPFGADGDTPFTTSFNVGSKPDPVSIAVLGFKGAASFALKMQPPPGGIVRFAASLAVGLELSAGGFGVSGTIGVEIGAFIEYDRDQGTDGEITIGGYFRVYGSITVWAVAEVGAEALLELTYLVNAKILRAKGTVTGWVNVLGAQKEWVLEVTEDIDVDNGGGSGAALGRGSTSGGGSSTGLTGFADLYDEPAWTTYCGAFA